MIKVTGFDFCTFVTLALKFCVKCSLLLSGGTVGGICEPLLTCSSYCKISEVICCKNLLGQIGLSKQCRSRSDCSLKGSTLFAILSASLVCISAL